MYIHNNQNSIYSFGYALFIEVITQRTKQMDEDTTDTTDTTDTMNTMDTIDTKSHDSDYDPEIYESILCVVRSYYDGYRRHHEHHEQQGKSESSNVTKGKATKRKNDEPQYITDMNASLLDFANVNPDRRKIETGCGFVTKVLDEPYVITCSHIVIRSANRYTAHFRRAGKIVEYNLELYCRIPELDMAIMKIIDFDCSDASADASADASTKEQIDCTRIDRILEKRIAIEQMSDVSGSIVVPIIPDQQNTKAEEKMEYQCKYFDQATIGHSAIITSLINSIPRISIPIERIDMFADIEAKYCIRVHDIKDYDKPGDDQKMMAEIISRSMGFSGALVRLDGENMGMVMTLAMSDVIDDQSEAANSTKLICSIRALPLDILLTVVDNCIRRHMKSVMGIQIEYGVVEVEEDGKEFHALSVVEQSARYSNGLKDFWFTKNDLVLKIDQMEFVFNGLNNVLPATKYGMNMPINSYALCKAIFEPNTDISMTIPKLYDGAHKRITFNIMPIPYNDMHTIRIYHGKEVFWRGFLFVELSEEMIRFYQSIGINLANSYKSSRSSLNGERMVLLFNYDNVTKAPIDMSYLKDRYPKMVEYKRVLRTNKTTQNRHFFYKLEKVSSRNVNNLDELYRIINNIRETNQKKITFQIKTGTDSVSRFTIK